MFLSGHLNNFSWAPLKMMLINHHLQTPTLQQQKRARHRNEDEDKALCVAVASGYAAVGYHGDGIKMFNLKSGK